MKKLARFSLAASLFIAAGRVPFAATVDVGGPDLERGKYIVEGVAMCGRCHTPVNDRGEADLRMKLMGAPIPNALAYWAPAAPRIAGIPPGTDEQFITLLTTGIARTGRPPHLPMPRFHMTRKDAESVLAYLKSLRR